MKKAIAMSIGMALMIGTAIIARAHENVKLTGYLVDAMCAASHMKSHPENADAFAAGHTKGCALMPECVESGYGIISGGKWYAFDAKGNELAKAIFDKTDKKDHISATVEGMEHDGKIMVEKLTAGE